MKRGLLWFRTDLRLADNLALHAALQDCEEIIPVYILDEQWLGTDRWGFPRTGPFRLQFQLESLQDLQTQLSAKQSDLIFRCGHPAAILPELAREYQCDRIYCSKEYTFEEIAVERALEEQVEVSYFHNSPMIHPDDLPFAIEKLPEVFTNFRKKVEKYSQIRSPLPAPEIISSPTLESADLPSVQDLGRVGVAPDPRGVLAFRGGATAGADRLRHYLWDTRQLSDYKETRNGLIGADYSSKFSAWLAQGCLSARTIYAEVERYEAEVEKNQSTYWMKFELLWRDFFKFTAMRYGKKIFLPGGIKDKTKNWNYRPETVQRWIDGATGDAFVDANMRELKETGFMSNRGRQNVASYLVHQLGQDWRVGAAWFESRLIDYDVTSNYGNWIYAAGVGNDPRDRVFNTQRQAERYDEHGDYRELWGEG
ncbi:DASH family cryptochrome [Flavilitoribacter nigricans]|uniref:Cryptochrome DASH n=1 Tax=Flavilitoribacter nigricans (strain ATCC 23147 / DSM 23189 / NBRC 102662 / NCIMB 1420 / SS-2) TaxID=1122177 RepID=A0A2D0ND65_FLAN2|nr:DASH family cryptochrome [Flavilitoribacter nigricans]PHN06119.1 deoxyribodipyrimidine photolyase [Flavilitoribacter nigricans DSM 23189 = NBRC 102662]